MNFESSVTELVRMFDNVLPLKSDQQFVFRQLVDSIAHCEKHGSAAWSITLTNWGFRLNVGQVEAMTCEFRCLDVAATGAADDIWFVHLRVFLAGDDVFSEIKLDDEVESIEEGAYSSVGERHWCYTRFFQAAKGSGWDSSRDAFGAQLRILRRNRDRYLSLVCHTSTGKLRQKSNFARSHCPALYELARIVTTVEPADIDDRDPCGSPHQRAAPGAKADSHDGLEHAASVISGTAIAKLLDEHAAATGREREVESGFVYLLVNRSMPGLVKIGHTKRAIGARVRELSMATGVPTPFDLILDLFVSDSAKAERLVHEQLASHRIATNREFFQVPTSMAIQAIYDAANAVNGEETC